jgi:hypothetical protein
MQHWGGAWRQFGGAEALPKNQPKTTEFAVKDTASVPQRRGI